MPIELKIWKLAGTELRPEPVTFGAPDLESHLEDAIVQDLSIVAPGLMLLGRQVATSWGKFIDILAIDSEGDLVVLELKRDKTPRDVVAQVLDYGSWVKQLSYDDVKLIFAEKNPDKTFESAFEEKFGAPPPQIVNAGHRLYVVAARLDSETERILNYLTEGYGVPVNAVFFNFFRDAATPYLARTWLRDPDQVEAQAPRAGTNRGHGENWNGHDYYVNVGEEIETETAQQRNWDDWRRYGFVSAGGGQRWVNFLAQLSPGARVNANIPGKGYVGVGIVTGTVMPAREMMVEVDGVRKSLLDAPLQAANMAHDEDTDVREHVVPVRWQVAVPREEAFRERGFFGNLNTVCKLRQRFTLDRLAEHFNLQHTAEPDTTAP